MIFCRVVKPLKAKVLVPDHLSLLRCRVVIFRGGGWAGVHWSSVTESESRCLGDLCSLVRVKNDVGIAVDGYEASGWRDGWVVCWNVVRRLRDAWVVKRCVHVLDIRVRGLWRLLWLAVVHRRWIACVDPGILVVMIVVGRQIIYEIRVEIWRVSKLRLCRLVNECGSTPPSWRHVGWVNVWSGW